MEQEQITTYADAEAAEIARAMAEKMASRYGDNGDDAPKFEVRNAGFVVVWIDKDGNETTL